jgi:hypothetical protein
MNREPYGNSDRENEKESEKKKAGSRRIRPRVTHYF